MTTAFPALSPEQARARRLFRERRNRIIRHVILLAWTGFIAFPIFWMVSTSFKDTDEWVTWPPHWLPQAPTLHNYAQIFAFAKIDPSLSRQATEQAFTIWKALADAILMCTTAALLALLLGTFLAYSISRFNVGGKYFRHTILTIRMIPPIVVAIPLTLYYSTLHLLDTVVGLVIVYTITTLPYAVWITKSFVDEVPREMEQAAEILGASRWRTVWEVIFPLVRSGVLATFLFILILTWSEYLMALILSKTDVVTLPIQLSKFEGTTEGRVYGRQAALAVGITFPLIIVGCLIRKHLVRGFSFGMVKR